MQVASWVMAEHAAVKVAPRRAHPGTAAWVMEELLQHKKSIFPPSIAMHVKDDLTGKVETKQVTLFGELLAKMEERIKKCDTTRELLVRRFSELKDISGDADINATA